MLKYSKEFLFLFASMMEKKSFLLLTFPHKQWQEQLMLLFDGQIKICRTLPLDFRGSAGFLDHRVILLSVMDLTKTAGNWISNWFDFLVCISSMHILWPLLHGFCPCSIRGPMFSVLLPSHYHHRHSGAAKTQINHLNLSSMFLPVAMPGLGWKSLLTILWMSGCSAYYWL